MKWAFKRGETRQIEPRRAVSTSALELETTKEILAEVFCASPRTGRVDDPEQAGRVGLG